VTYGPLCASKGAISDPALFRLTAAGSHRSTNEGTETHANEDAQKRRIEDQLTNDESGRSPEETSDP
jgi:hypothetical protein